MEATDLIRELEMQEVETLELENKLLETLKPIMEVLDECEPYYTITITADEITVDRRVREIY